MSRAWNKMYFGLHVHLLCFGTDCLVMGIGFLLLFKFNHGKWKKDKVGLRRLVVYVALWGPGLGFWIGRPDLIYLKTPFWPFESQPPHHSSIAPYLCSKTKSHHMKSTTPFMIFGVAYFVRWALAHCQDEHTLYSRQPRKRTKVSIYPFVTYYLELHMAVIS